MAQANPEDERWDGNQQKEQINSNHNRGGGIKNNNATATATTTSNSSSTSGFKFNAQAAEFIPRSHQHMSIKADDDTNQMPISPPSTSTSAGYFYPSSCLNMQMQFLDPTDHHWYYVNNNNNNNTNIANTTTITTTMTTTTTTATAHPAACSFSLFPHSLATVIATTSNINNNNSILTQDLQQKIVKQVEYLFSDLSLMANDTMAKHVSKDPEGYVPIPVIASMKKIKALITDHHLLVQALTSSTKLVISKDSKKVKRRNPFTEHYKDELQSRTVIVENLPDDHSYQNLEKIFGVVGSVKAIRLCHPPEANPIRSKTEVIISNKLHALVEYENGEIAERAAERLNDERNWRKGMRVRVMQRRTPKSVLKGRKLDFDSLTLTDDEEPRSPESPQQETSQHHQLLNANANTASDSEEYSPGSGSGSRKSISNSSVVLRGPGSGAGRGKTKGRISIGSGPGRGLLASPTATLTATAGTHSSTTGSNNDAVATSPLMSKQQQIGIIINKGPRMPDGTRGFTMGRGKPLKP